MQKGPRYPPQSVLFGFRPNLALHLGISKGVQSINKAVKYNPIPFLIPCHRVIKETGDIGFYGEGKTRKKIMLAWEAVQKEKICL